MDNIKEIDIKEIVSTVVEKHFAKTAKRLKIIIRDDTCFNEELNADELDVIEIIFALENEFGIEIPDEWHDEGQITSINSIADALQESDLIPSQN